MPLASPLDVVQTFIGEWAHGPDGLRRSFVRWLAEDVRYENVGKPPMNNLAEACALLDTFSEVESIDVDMLAIAQDGDRVFTERVEYLRGSDGYVVITFRVMGIFVVRDGKISEWRDYFYELPVPATEGIGLS